MQIKYYHGAIFSEKEKENKTSSLVLFYSQEIKLQQVPLLCPVDNPQLCLDHLKQRICWRWLTAHVTTDCFTHGRRTLGNSRKQLQSPAVPGTRLLELQ